MGSCVYGTANGLYHNGTAILRSTVTSVFTFLPPPYRREQSQCQPCTRLGSEQHCLELMSLAFMPVGGPTGMKTSRDFGLKVGPTVTLEVSL